MSLSKSNNTLVEVSWDNLVFTDQLGIRTKYEGEDYEKFKNSIRLNGIQQKPLTRPYRPGGSESREHIVPGKYEVCDGLHRLTASHELGETVFEVFVNPTLSDDDVQILQYNLNERRLKTKPLDKLHHIQRFMSRHPLFTYAETAEAFAMHESELSNLLSLHKLTSESTKLVEDGTINLVKAIWLVKLPEHMQNDYHREATEMPGGEFGEFVKQIRRAAGKAETEKTPIGPIAKPLGVSKILEKLSIAKFDLSQSQPESEDFALYTGRLQMAEEICQVDAISVARRAEVNAIKVQRKEQDKLTRKIETDAKMLADLKARQKQMTSERVEPLAV